MGEPAGGGPFASTAHPQVRPVAAILGAWTALQLLFAPAAFRVDEPNIIAIARQIARAPLDPYGFTINWVGTEAPALEVLANPPLLPAWLAAWASLFGWSEISLHLSLLPFSAGALVAIALLARETGADPRTAALLLAISPAFFLAAQVAMPDVPMLALLLVSLLCAVRCFRGGGAWWLWGGVAAGLLAGVTKYNAVVLIAPVGVLALFATAIRRKGGLAAIALSPAAGIALFNAASAAVYGRSHFAALAKLQSAGAWPVAGYVVASIGIALLPLALLPALVTRVPPVLRVAPIPVAAFSALLGFVLEMRPITLLMVVVATVAGVQALLVSGLAAVRAFRGREWEDLMCAALIAATFAAQYRLLFTSVRYLLLMLPPLILVLVRDSARRSVPLRRGAVFASAILALAVAAGDVLEANAYRRFVRGELAVPLENMTGRLFIAGHWGFQYYAAEMGGRPVDASAPPELRAGDLFVVADSAVPVVRTVRAAAGTEVRSREVAMTSIYPLRTIDCVASANFYANVLSGCSRPAAQLPWGVSGAPLERFTIHEVRDGGVAGTLR
jgi:4-amino-4-deoxy-L-arabinose transferase-like glycosyltransferase